MGIKISGNKIADCKTKISFVSLADAECNHCGFKWKIYTDDKLCCLKCKSQDISLTFEKIK